jgi:hypothetical protein
MDPELHLSMPFRRGTGFLTHTDEPRSHRRPLAGGVVRKGHQDHPAGTGGYRPGGQQPSGPCSDAVTPRRRQQGVVDLHVVGRARADAGDADDVAISFDDIPGGLTFCASPDGAVNALTCLLPRQTPREGRSRQHRRVTGERVVDRPVRALQRPQPHVLRNQRFGWTSWQRHALMLPDRPDPITLVSPHRPGVAGPCRAPGRPRTGTARRCPAPERRTSPSPRPWRRAAVRSTTTPARPRCR